MTRRRAAASTGTTRRRRGRTRESERPVRAAPAAPRHVHRGLLTVTGPCASSSASRRRARAWPSTTWRRAGPGESPAAGRPRRSAPVGMSAIGFHVGALDQADVYARIGQRVRVIGRAPQVRLHCGAQAIGHPAGGDVEYACEDSVSLRCLLGPDLHAPAHGEGVRDGGEAVRSGRCIPVQGKVREVRREPDIGGRRRRREQLEVSSSTRSATCGSLTRSPNRSMLTPWRWSSRLAVVSSASARDGPAT